MASRELDYETVADHLSSVAANVSRGGRLAVRRMLLPRWPSPARRRPIPHPTPPRASGLFIKSSRAAGLLVLGGHSSAFGINGMFRDGMLLGWKMGRGA